MPHCLAIATDGPPLETVDTPTPILRMARIRLRPIILALAISLLPTVSSAETIFYEIYELSWRGQPHLIAQGRKEYTLKDIALTQHEHEGTTIQAKKLPIAEGFSVGASVFREKRLEGLGLWMRKDDGGFSWEWFRKESGNVFRKLQGPGRVKVTLLVTTDYEELAAVEFLDDITLRLNTHWLLWFIPFMKDDTHHMVVRKGSVLRVAP